MVPFWTSLHIFICELFNYRFVVSAFVNLLLNSVSLIIDFVQM